ncbi:MAG: hypothetical protein II007_03755 [Gammaproteobacteria bacterium]|nr:hypothetical protein [Gammaproteobacteria bacterium]
MKQQQPQTNGQQGDWLNRLVRALHREGGLAFRDRRGELVLVTPSSKQPGYWQATWFAAGGPFRDRLAISPRRLLWQIRPSVCCLLSRQQAEYSLRQLLS